MRCERIPPRRSSFRGISGYSITAMWKWSQLRINVSWRDVFLWGNRLDLMWNEKETGVSQTTMLRFPQRGVCLNLFRLGESKYRLTAGAGLACLLSISPVEYKSWWCVALESLLHFQWKCTDSICAHSDWTRPIERKGGWGGLTLSWFIIILSFLKVVQAFHSGHDNNICWNCCWIQYRSQPATTGLNLF